MSPSNRPPRSLQCMLVDDRFTVSRLNASDPIPEWATRGPYFFITRTPEELAVACPEGQVPAGVKSQRGYLCLKIVGPILLAESGVLISLIGPLSERGIPIYVVSSYDTDYILFLEEYWGMALKAIREAGHELLENAGR